MTLDVQFLTLILMVGSGALLGASFDVIGVTVRQFRLHTAVQALLDIAYWALSTMFVFRVLFHANYGQVRLFIFLGLALGAVLYFWLLGRPVRRSIELLLLGLLSLVRFFVRVVRILFRPVLYIVRLFIRLSASVYRGSAKVAIFLGKNMIQYSMLIWRRVRRRR